MKEIMERWDEQDQEILQKYAHDKLDQLDAMDAYVTANGYSWERTDTAYDTDGNMTANKKATQWLSPHDVMAIRDNARFHLVKELKDAGIDLYPPKPTTE